MSDSRSFRSGGRSPARDLSRWFHSAILAATLALAPLGAAAGVVFSGSTPHTVVLAQGSSPATMVPPGVTGQCLRGATGADPSWGTCSGSGGVASVSVQLPLGEFTCTGNPITGTGTINCDWNNENANLVLAGPASGSPGLPTFRGLVALDIPPLPYVTSVALTAPPEFNVGGSPVTAAGTLAITKANQSANQVYAGPSSGSPAPPTFRALTSADLPGGVGTVTSVALSPPSSIISVAGSPITGAGTLTESLLTQAANAVWAGPTSGGASAPTFRALVAGDIPSLSSLYMPLSGAQFTGAFGGAYSQQIPTTGFSITIPNNVNALVLNPAGTLATGTVILPASPTDGELETILSSAAISSFTLSPNTGQTLLNAPNVLGAGTSLNYRWSAATTTWYRSGEQLSNSVRAVNSVFAGPSSGPSAGPSFRLLTAADIPALSYVTSVSSANGDLTVATPTTTPLLTINSAPKLDTGRTLAITGDLAWTSPSFDGSGNVTAAGTLATVNANVGTFGDATHAAQVTLNAKGLVTAAASVLIVPGANTITRSMLAQGAANTVLGNFTGSTANEADNAVPSCPDSSGNHLNYVSGSGLTCGTSDSHGGTVTSVGLSPPASIFSVSGSPVTSAGTLTESLLTQSANLIWAGPASGAAAAPTFRAMVAADCVLPTASSVGCIQSKAATSHQWVVSISTAGVVTTTQPAFSDISGTLAASQCPAPSASTVGCLESAAAVTHQWISAYSIAGVPTLSQPAFSDISGTATAAQGGTGVASPTAHNLVVAEGASAMTPIAPGASGQLVLSQGAAADPAFAAMSGDATIANTGAIAVSKIAGVAPGALYPLNVGNGLLSSGGALQALSVVTESQTPGGATLTLTNADCGTQINSNSAGGTLVVTLPGTPTTGCALNLIAQGNAITLTGITGGLNVNGTNQTSDFTLPLLANLSSNNATKPYRIVWGGARWNLIDGFGPQVEAVPNGSIVDPLDTHGQVYLSLTGTTLQLCPANGPGGLILSHTMHQVPKCDGSTGFGAVLPAANMTGSSVLNYIYALAGSTTISSADNTSCNGRLTVGASANFYQHSTINIVNLGNTTEANGTWLIASIPDSTHICLAGITFTHTGADTGNVTGVAMIASATGHATDNSSITNGADDGVEVASNNGNRTLVGIVYVGASLTLNDSATKRDVLSWFNRQPKKMIVQEATGTGRTVAASTGAGVFKTLGTVIEGEFVIAAPQTQPGSVPTNSAEWHVIALLADGGVSGVCAVGATFNTTAQSGNAAVTGELEVAGATIGTVVTDQEDMVHASGLATGLTEGRDFIDIAGWNTALNPCGLNGGLVPSTLEAIVWQ